MPKIITKTVYNFDELSDEAKEKAREWMREISDYDDFYSESVIDDAKEVGKLMGIDIDKVYYSGFSSQGDGACFVGNYSYAKGSVRAVKEYAPQDSELHRIVTGLQKEQARYFYQLSAKVTHSYRYYFSRSTDIEVYDYRSGDSIDNDTIKELLWDFMDWIYKNLRTDYEYQNSDEAIDEAIKVNEYTFTIDGKREG